MVEVHDDRRRHHLRAGRFRHVRDRRHRGRWQATEPNEIRGTSITGGDIRRIAKGDVIIVPNGTPHWFKDVPAR